MSDWKTTRQDIELLDKRLAQSNDFELEQLWDMHEERLFLRNLMYQCIEKASPEEIIHTTHVLCEAENKLHDAILAKTDSHRQEILQTLAEISEYYHREIGQVGTDETHSDSVITAILQGFAGDISFFKRLSSLVEDKEERSSLFDIVNEIFYVLNTKELQSLCMEQPDLSKRLSILRKNALERKVRAFAGEVEKIGNGEQKDHKLMWSMLFWGNTIRYNLSRSEPSHDPLKEKCQENRQKIREALDTYLNGLGEEQRFRLLEEMAMEMYDHANEIMSQIEQNSLPLAIKQLASTREDTIWMLGILASHCKNGNTPKSLQNSRKKLRKMDKYLRAELQEKKLQERLEGIFGKKFVAFFENLILFLIFAVVVLLMIEGTHPGMAESTHRLFLWVDAGICFVFLLEFFTKLLLAEGKRLYFWRHWLIDLLPSIPFGLLLLHAGTLQTVDYSRSVRAARFVRVSRMARLVRYVRILRPVIRFFRVFSFLVRGTDRLVRRYSRWLNRNIVFFSAPNEITSDRDMTLQQRFQDSYSRCLARSRVILAQADPNSITPFLSSYIESLDVRVQKSNGGWVLKEEETLSKDISVEDVLYHLLRLRGAQVEELMGSEFAKQVYRYAGFLNAPLICHLPYVSSMLKRHRVSTAADFTASLGRSVGRLFEKALAIVYWFIDLYGIVTGPRLVDRIGGTLITSFKRPAKRLLIIGSVFLIFDLLAGALPFAFLKKVAGGMETYIGTPVIVLGGICLVPLLLGMWFRHIAGEATGFYERTVEAQFINLLKELKLYNSERDLHLLYKRVLQPEMELDKEQEESPSQGAAFVQKMCRELVEWAKEEEKRDKTRITTRKEAGRWKLLHQVMLLYRDYLDGAPLHHSDVKTTEQLLGNITIRNILVHRLGYGKKEFKEFEKLDLTHGRSIVGPYLWFSLITQSVAHNTAQLIIDYNTHSIRDTMIEAQSEESLAQYHDWLDRRKALKTGKAQKCGNKKKKKGQRKKRGVVPLYATTQFTAMHFLSSNRQQDESIRLDFEDELYQLFIEDRRQMVREVFSTYPLCFLPRSQRVLNIYLLYTEYMAGGRIFTLPFKMFGWTMMGLGIVIKWFYQKVREILNPGMEKKIVAPALDFRVVVRKINRMRKPVFMHCMKVRAEFDFEYLGVSLPGRRGLPMHKSLVLDARATAGQSYFPFEHDLDFIRALDSERDYFYELRQKRREQIHCFSQFLHSRGWEGEGLARYLEQKSLASNENEILRALTIAFTVDYRRLASLIKARDTIERVFKKGIRQHGKVKGYRFYKHFAVFLYRLTLKWIFRQEDWERESFENFLEHSKVDVNCDHKKKKWCWKAYQAKRTQLKELLFFITQEGSVEIIDEIIENIVCHPGSWTEELIAIRSVQTLSVLDVENYRRHIARLGEYPESELYANKQTSGHPEN